MVNTIFEKITKYGLFCCNAVYAARYGTTPIFWILSILMLVSFVFDLQEVTAHVRK